VHGAVSIEAGPAAESEVAGAHDAWVARLRAGDPVALDRLARQESPRVARLLYSMLGPHADMEDLIQNVFLEACRAMPTYRGDGALSSFVAGIAVRVARRALRPTPWRTRRSELVAEPVAHSGDPERALRQAEQIRRLHRALNKIAPRKRIAFVLWALEGLDVPAIAKLTSASEAATKSRIFYAQKELKRMAERDPHLRELIGGGADAS
jgi:RNA polymerase sigma-70 factor (ECF subfamily)